MIYSNFTSSSTAKSLYRFSQIHDCVPLITCNEYTTNDCPKPHDRSVRLSAEVIVIINAEKPISGTSESQIPRRRRPARGYDGSRPTAAADSRQCPCDPDYHSFSPCMPKSSFGPLRGGPYYGTSITTWINPAAARARRRTAAAAVLIRVNLSSSHGDSRLDLKRPGLDS